MAENHPQGAITTFHFEDQQQDACEWKAICKIKKKQDTKGCFPCRPLDTWCFAVSCSSFSLPLLGHFLPSGFPPSYHCAIFVWDPPNSCCIPLHFSHYCSKNSLLGLSTTPSPVSVFPKEKKPENVMSCQRHLRGESKSLSARLTQCFLTPHWGKHSPRVQGKKTHGHSPSRGRTGKWAQATSTPFLMWPWEGCVWKWWD